MAISVNGLYKDVAREVGVGSGTQELADAFVRAVNDTLDRLSALADLPTPLTHIESTDDEIDDDVADNQRYIIKAGTILNLMRSGYRSRDPKMAMLVMADAKDAWDEGAADFIMAADNDEQAASDDAEIVGFLRDDDNA